ncbi:MAG: transposase [Proteobacteria bacterium]|nr:transposase [Pseudomonadota bacterium]
MLEKTRLFEKTKRFAACDRILDSGIGELILSDPHIAQVVVDALLQFDGERYALIAWCVMPNHVHVVIEPFGDHLLSAIVKSWKAFSGAQINRMIGRSGRLWAPELF